MNNQPPPSNKPYPSDCELLEGYRSRARERLDHEKNAENSLLLSKAKSIELLLLDVDGVLTDGTLIYQETGIEAKSFNTQDGLGIRLIQKIGVDAGLITARKSEIVQRRASELGLQYVYQGVKTKLASYKEIVKTSGLKPFQICYMGDDWIDLPILNRVGLAACPANSVPEVKDVCHYITERIGGHGAVRQVCNLILLAKGARDNLLQQYLL